jgi:hypothetical protein
LHLIIGQASSTSSTSSSSSDSDDKTLKNLWKLKRTFRSKWLVGSDRRRVDVPTYYYIHIYIYIHTNVCLQSQARWAWLVLSRAFRRCFLRGFFFSLVSSCSSVATYSAGNCWQKQLAPKTYTYHINTIHLCICICIYIYIDIYMIRWLWRRFVKTLVSNPSSSFEH